MAVLLHNRTSKPQSCAQAPAETVPSAPITGTKLTSVMTKAVTFALLCEVISHFIEYGPHQPIPPNLLRLVGVIVLVFPALFVAWVPEKPFVRVSLILAGVGLALSVILDLTKDIHVIEDWMLVGNHSAIRGNLRWATLVGGIFLLFVTLYRAMGELITSRSSLQAERQELLAEMRQRRLAEEKAQAARDLAQNLIHTANAIVIGLDAEYRLTIFNKTAEQITGYSREELGERDWFDTLMPPERYPQVRERLRYLMRSGLPKHLESTIQTKSGEERQIAWSNSEVIEGGQVTGTIAFGLDVTDRRREEVELLRSSRLATLGVVAAGLAHEIGNPLASLSARLNLMQENGDPAFWRESIDTLQRHITRISRIVHGVSRFSRPLRLERRECNINALVTDALDIVRFHERAKHCEIGMELASIPPKVMATPDQLIQVFLNLGLNALEAMPDGGTLTVATRMPGQMVEVMFRDTGTGLTEEAKSKMFDAFYTSKADGMGLGLNISRSIINNHNGRIEFENNVDGGTCFRVLLPVADASPPEHEGAAGALT